MTQAWTYADLAQLTELADDLASLEAIIGAALQPVHCHHCGVQTVPQWKRYCDTCVEQIVEYLAQAQVEQDAVDRGLY